MNEKYNTTSCIPTISTQMGSNKNMAISFVTDCSKSSESTDTPLPPTEVAAIPPRRQERERDQNRRKKAYKWYKKFSKPTKATMCSIVDYTKDTDITRQDVDLLPWNLEETKVIKEAMKSQTKTELKDMNNDKKKKKKDKKEKERDGTEETAFAKLKGKMDYISMSSDSSWNAISDSLDTSSTSMCWDQDHTQDVEEEHNRRRAERLRKREAAKKSMPEVKRADHTACCERAFEWYTRLGMPTRTEFKRKATAMESINLTPIDIDLLPWNLTGRAVNVAKMNAMVRASVLNAMARVSVLKQ
jgi:hypothetical protein